ncbi:SMI1/KNR4 family protein [Leptolyngbya sp. FACHB-321]|uniref:SMI1/KNR4 family protein n=1 Tax=Leptolyngbya sp. FACHB-321 TaxID=2692807 RepID=UPI001689187F|nr:SMI1/KNR4 family protein [Leptolyngbya sp. FACHB-321]MBD2037573.1 SMI1/KNR4 family protein [Leptolyngbya sp. FACHB-321]
MYLDQAKARFSEFYQTIPEKHKPASPYVAVPSSEAEIKAMEKALKLSFPAAYQEFLLWMGKDIPSFMNSEVFSLRTLPRNREDAIELLEENECNDSLPDDAIVFAWYH